MNQFYAIFIRVAALLLMILGGFIARRKKILTEESTHALSVLLINFIFPASIYNALVQNFTLREIFQHWRLPLAEFLILGIGFLVAIPVLKLFPQRDNTEKRMFHYQCTLLNFLFLPLPLVAAFYGDRGVGLLSLGFIGGETAVWTLGVIALSGSLNLSKIKNILNMPILAMLAAMLTLIAGELIPQLVPVPGTLYSTAAHTLLETIRIFGAGTTGISMIVAGSGMAVLQWEKIFDSFHLTFVGCRLVLIPICALFFLHFFPIDPTSKAILSLVAIMPVSVSSAVYGQAVGANANTAATGILLSHLGCLITIPVFYAIIF